MVLNEGMELGRKPEGNYWNYVARRRIEDSGLVFYLSPTKVQNFGEMDALRKQALPAGEFGKMLDSEEGRLVANIGVSLAPVCVFKGRSKPRHFAGLVHQLRPDFGDNVYKLPSEYVIADNRIPHERLFIENIIRGAVEELQFFTGDEKVLPCVLGDGTQKEHPFKGALNYADQSLAYTLKFPGSFVPNGAARAKVIIEDENGRREVQGNPHIYFSSQTNSGQIVYPAEIVLPGVPVTGYHTEEDMDKASGMLVAKLRKQKFVFVPLEDGRATRDIYHLRNGRLVPAQPLKLSEAFAPQEDGVLAPGPDSRSLGNIPLEECIAEEFTQPLCV